VKLRPDRRQVLRVDVADFLGQQQLGFEFGKGSASNVQECQEFASGPTCRPLSNIRRDRDCGPPQLRAQAEEFMARQGTGQPMNRRGQCHGFLPENEILVVSSVTLRHPERLKSTIVQAHRKICRNSPI
jgi:hypothetical protein